MGFMQLIEYRTSRHDELEALLDHWAAATEGLTTARRSIECSDRDEPNTYVAVVEFPTYEDAMRNSELPQTAEFAARAAALCDASPTFRNFDIVHRIV
jgi:hypothetical protein